MIVPFYYDTWQDNALSPDSWQQGLFQLVVARLVGDRFCAVDAFYAPVASRFLTYSVALKPESQAYADALLQHPATQAFFEAGKRESWVLEFNEFDIE